MDKLKQQRKIIKSAITRIYNVCNDSNSSEIEISVRVEKLESYFKNFEEIQGEIEAAATTSEELNAEEDQRIQVEARYYAVKALHFNRGRNENIANTTRAETSNQQLVTAVENIARNQSTLGELLTRLSSNESTTSTPITTIQQPIIQRDTIKLPRIHLPDFDGAYTDWIRFRDLFEVTIHNNLHLANIEKFEYLQCHLKGDALSVIKHLSPSNDNYDIGWQLLKEKFNDFELIKKGYLKLLFDQPSMKGPVTSELKRLINNINESVNALKTLKEQVDHWGSVLLFKLERKLDSESQTLWYRSATNTPSFTKFMEFLVQRLREFENQAENKMTQRQPFIKNKIPSHVYASMMKACLVCKGGHMLYLCDKFKTLDINERRRIVRCNNLCYNCLQSDHLAGECKRSNCKKCNYKHHTLLHKETNSTTPSAMVTTTDRSQQVGINMMYTNQQQTITLLPTAIVLIKDQNDIFQPCRVLLDTGAQVSIISESCVQRLKLKRAYDNTVLCGIGKGNYNNARGKVTIMIKSNNFDYSFTTTALCFPKLTQYQPSIQVMADKFKFFDNLILADMKFNTPGSIDVILGADTFGIWSLNKHIVHPSGSPTAMSTIFGWAIIGKVSTGNTQSITVAHTSIDFSDQLQQFWEIEELIEKKTYATEEEKAAELFYQQTVSRNENGRYMVRLPFKSVNRNFGNTITQALRRFNNMENKLKNNSLLETGYCKFMEEYIKLNHMELIPQSDNAQYILPHHAVFKGDSSTTKLRVVFDGSAKGSMGISLNDQLLVGPTIQADIFTILLQFRKGKIGLTGDIEKMYRQILVHPEDRRYQCILWRENSQQQISTFLLNTVTYGTSAAPFLAVRTLKQVAMDYQHENANVSDIIQQCFYVDDLMYCAPDIITAINTRKHLSNILMKAGFHLRKWSSNSDVVLETIDYDDRELKKETPIDDQQTVKTLGLYWDTNEDVFKYKLSIPDLPSDITKRMVLSIIARIFDPLGWASPVVVTMKIFMQKLWLRGLDWDSKLPNDLLSQWTLFHNNIEGILMLKIPRWLQYGDHQSVELHGFADSSEMAYAAVVFLKIIHKDNTVTTRLVASKTKVAPVKQVTLPRLELCAAQLVVKLLIKVKTALNISNAEMFGWTDSTIVLAWLADHPRKWKNFVANRTSFIINLLPAQHWRHIRSNQNPADVATRGSTPTLLSTNKLWWYGPPILETNDYRRSCQDEVKTTEVELRTKTILHVISAEKNDLLHKYSNFTTLVRVTAFLLRFIKNCQPQKYTRSFEFLKTDEIKCAHDTLIKFAQHQSFPSEIKILSSGQQLASNHKLLSLSPFLDAQGLMRVGGRLENANIPYDQKHPIILDKASLLSELLVRHCHLKHLHAGARQLQYLLSQKYWIPSVVHIIKRCVYKCVICIRYRKKPCEQLMGNLPKHRLEISTAFQNCGVDFAGPLLIRSWKGRGSKQYKCWVALFVCLSTKAIHLELVTELSTDAFIAALRRFTSRRGKPNNIFSDNGTNFIGCNKRLLELIQFMNTFKTKECIANETNSNGIKWHFSPPSGPHFGGIWEAGVKSMKYHLYRVLGSTSVTYEELTTVLCQIECCLNSRPIVSKFEGDTDPLTPAHFLIMKGMCTIPDKDYLNTKINRLTNWQHLQKLVQHFWQKWSNDYLKQMQTRSKWKIKLENLKKDDVVIIINDTLPPAKWSIGRIVHTHPGLDGLVRVVTVRTQSGDFKRPISKLCPLLIDV